MVRGRIAGAPTPDICGRCAVPRTPTGPPYRFGAAYRGRLRARATGYRRPRR
eukprot:gene21304-biopygen11657